MRSFFNNKRKVSIMSKNLTEIIFIVDRSGSMQSIRQDMIGGFNAFIQKQRELPTDCKVSFYQFDTEGPKVEVVYEERNLNEVPVLTTETFVPRGGTPLLDAVAIVVKRVQARIDKTPEDARPQKVLVVVITDGEENSSTEWNGPQVKQIIEHQEEAYKWEFVYLGANQNAWAVGGNLGFKASSTLGYVASATGTTSMWNSLSDKTVKYRCSEDVTRGVEFDDADKSAQVKEGLTS